MSESAFEAIASDNSVIRISNIDSSSRSSPTKTPTAVERPYLGKIFLCHWLILDYTTRDGDGRYKTMNPAVPFLVDCVSRELHPLVFRPEPLQYLLEMKGGDASNMLEVLQVVRQPHEL
jgi:hypothetical protein